MTECAKKNIINKIIIIISLLIIIMISSFQLIRLPKYRFVYNDLYTLYVHVVKTKGNIITNFKNYNKELQENKKLNELYYSKTLRRNNESTLDIKTYDGSNQLTHPDILYDKNGIFNHKYWLAFTPYPYYNDKLENPSIVVSEDGKKFVETKGIKNPLDDLRNEKNFKAHLSDTDIMFRNNELILHYVYNVSGVLGPAKFYQVKSKDGINWSRPKLVYKTHKNKEGYSPTFVSENNTIKMWYYEGENKLMYTESEDEEKSWKPIKKCNINMGNWRGWHVDIIKTNIGYEGLICARLPKLNQRALFYVKSKDGINWKTSKNPLIFPKKNSWDSKDIYRSTFIIDKNKYKVWYAAVNNKRQWHVSYVEFKKDEIENLEMN
ncbi:hypothetical protein [Clostridium botulinum]|uniref:hypothetical protein n=1 Tax=Clostridium botulinum TaxID=1491 RepID=UPI000A468DE2|nr:hypothetical protein [Clostridium botulinum]MCR1147431.1 hypothetical protein [Clostridium botulinum]